MCVTVGARERAAVHRSRVTADLHLLAAEVDYPPSKTHGFQEALCLVRLDITGLCIGRDMADVSMFFSCNDWWPRHRLDSVGMLEPRSWPEHVELASEGVNYRFKPPMTPATFGRVQNTPRQIRSAGEMSNAMR